MVSTGAIIYRQDCDKAGRGEWGRKALGAINKLVMRTQSRMVMRGEIICWVRKDRDGERNRRRRKTPSLA